MSLRYQGALQTVVVATLISLGLFVLVKRPRHRPAQLLTLMCLLTTGWILLDIGTTMGEQAILSQPLSASPGFSPHDILLYAGGKLC